MENIEKIREQFPITKNKVFMNHAGQSPLPKTVADAIRKYVNDFSNFGTTSIEWNDNRKPLFAKLIGAKPQEIEATEYHGKAGQLFVCTLLCI
jgi:selenocysteine lyase/cysteine desulfurase